MRRITSGIVWEGPSRLDPRDRVVAIITSPGRLGKRNRKIGSMLQLWILPIELSPLRALKRSRNRAVCGSCPMQGRFSRTKGKMIGRKCYVNIGHAPQNIWRKYRRGGYPTLDANQICELVRGKALRLGAYGDPAALPLWLIGLLVRLAERHTGYSHSLWDLPPDEADRLASYCMHSADTPADLLRARQRGWRSFLCVPIGAEPPKTKGLIECRATAKGLDCAHCRLCGGSDGRPDIWIRAHSKCGFNHKWSDSDGQATAHTIASGRDSSASGVVGDCGVGISTAAQAARQA